MESELQKFRQKKRVERYKSQFVENVHNGWSRFAGTITRALLPDKEDSSDEGSEQDAGEGQDESLRTTKMRPSTSKLKRKKDSMDGDGDNIQLDDTKSANSKLLHYTVMTCKILIWFCLFMGFLKLELGAIFVIVSIFWLMWINMNTGKRKKRGRNAGPSAYSVFNPNCESIDGTLKAEQLEKQMLFREVK